MLARFVVRDSERSRFAGPDPESPRLAERDSADFRSAALLDNFRTAELPAGLRVTVWSRPAGAGRRADFP